MKNFFVISGSSGSGKTTLLESLSRDLNMDISVSCTTRNKRKYEIDGVHYSFVSEEKFQDMIDENKFLEYENVHGDLYGTPLDSVRRYMEENKSIFLELDVKGALSFKKIYPSNTISIFLSPPNLEELRHRLVNRSTESTDEIEKRLSRFEEEDNLKKEFDYTLINDNFETTFEKLKKMVISFKEKD
jgi:guanylate kinase